MRPSLFAVIALALVTADVAYGYIDPGPTNLIIQFLIAMGAGSLFFAKRLWTAAFGLFSKNKPKPQSLPKAADAETPKAKKKRSKAA